MNKRFVNGLIISGDPDKITSVSFIPVNDFISNTGYDIEVDLANRRIIIRYLSSIWNASFDKIQNRSYGVEPVLLPGYSDGPQTQIEPGVWFLEPTIRCNGIEYIKGKNNDISYMYQYLISENHINKSIATKVENLGFVSIVRDIDLVDHKEIDEYGKEVVVKKWGLDEYLSHINNSNPDSIIAHPYNKAIFNIEYIKTIQAMPFSNQEIISKDATVLYQINEFALNEAMCIANFVKALKKKYPEIDIYHGSENINTEYSEHIQFHTTLGQRDGAIFNSIVHEDDYFGRYLVTTIPVQMEYSTQDVPLLLARKDAYRVGKFLNELRTFMVPMKVKGIDSPLLFQCSLFWDRNNMPDEYSPVQNMDQNQWAAFTYPYQCYIIVTLLEHKPWIGKSVLNVINKVIEAKRTTDPNIVIKGLDTSTHNTKLVLFTDEYGNEISELQLQENSPSIIQIEIWNGSYFGKTNVWDENTEISWSVSDKEKIKIQIDENTQTICIANLLDKNEFSNEYISVSLKFDGEYIEFRLPIVIKESTTLV